MIKIRMPINEKKVILIDTEINVSYDIIVKKDATIATLQITCNIDNKYTNNVVSFIFYLNLIK